MSSRKIDKLEQENKRLKQESQQLKLHIKELNQLFIQLQDSDEMNKKKQQA